MLPSAMLLTGEGLQLNRFLQRKHDMAKDVEISDTNLKARLATAVAEKDRYPGAIHKQQECAP